MKTKEEKYLEIFKELPTEWRKAIIDLLYWVNTVEEDAKKETLWKIREKMDYFRVKLGLEYRDAWLRLLLELKKMVKT